MNSIRFGMRPISVLAVMALPLASCDQNPVSASNETTGAIPNLSGLWAREYIGLDLPESGEGPIVNLARIPTGQSDLDTPVGDYNNPILLPAAAEILKGRGEMQRTGKNFPQPSNQCAPHQPPYVLYAQQIALLQRKDEVIILYQHAHQARHIRLNAQHSENATPSWSGDSTGHYEGETLVVDTIGIKAGPFSMADTLDTPQSEAMHVVERYRLIDYEAAIAEFKRTEKENIHVLPSAPIGDGISIDPNYRGKGLQIQITVDDANVFTKPWSASVNYLGAGSDWVEVVCAENTREYYADKDTVIPHADQPDS